MIVKATVIILNIILFLCVACESAPNILPIGDFEIVKIVDTDADIIYPNFIEENRIIFYSREHTDTNIVVFQTDTLGVDIVVIFDGNKLSKKIVGLPTIDRSGSKIAFTMGEFTTDDYYSNTGNVRFFQSDVYVYHIQSAEIEQITHNGISHLAEWLGENTILVVAADSGSSFIQEIHYICASGCSPLHCFNAKRYQVINVSNDSVVTEILIKERRLCSNHSSEKHLNQMEISVIRDSLKQIEFLYDYENSGQPFLYFSLFNDVKEQYDIVWSDTSKLFLTREFTDTRDRFRKKYDLVAVDQKTLEWTTIVKSIPGWLVLNMTFSPDYVLTVNGRYKVGKVTFEGNAEHFLQINESVRICGISASPSGQLFVVSAWIGKGGYNLYLIKKKQD